MRRLVIAVLVLLLLALTATPRSDLSERERRSTPADAMLLTR